MTDANRATSERTPDLATIAGFLDYWERIRGRTVRVARVIPPERIEWAPAAGRFTLGDLLRHGPSSGGDVIILRDLNTLAWWLKSTPVFASRSSSATC